MRRKMGRTMTIAATSTAVPSAKNTAIVAVAAAATAKSVFTFHQESIPLKFTDLCQFCSC